MGYDSTINFTLDTICPWTYIAKKRLEAALEQVRKTDPPVKFTVEYRPFQLFNDAPIQGEDKYQWYLKNKYNSDKEKMKVYTTYMSALGVGSGINFKFGGTIANTLNAHRLIQWVQEKYGAEKADAVVKALYQSYFEEEQHPSSTSTLLKAAHEAGISESEAKGLVEDESEGLQDVKMLIREQVGNGIDSVPYINIEGKRRDVTLEGAKEVEEYVKALEQIIKESS